MKIRFAIGLATVGLLISGIASSVLAAPENPNCWGTVTSQRASTLHDVGEHASDPPPLPEPLDRPGRAGLGNNPFGHVSELGSFLASIDGIPETECP
jgi:hypothetical protein